MSKNTHNDFADNLPKEIMNYLITKHSRNNSTTIIIKYEVKLIGLLYGFWRTENDMGVYDTIIAKCPNCGVDNYFQSKSGECCLYEYEIETAPFEAMMNANRHTPQECEKCKKMLIVDIEHRKLLLADDSQNSV